MRPSQVLTTGLTKRLGGAEVVSEVDLALEGGIVTLLGPNGSGKTTLLRCLATVSVASSGDLWIDGLDPRHETDRIEARRRLRYLPQDCGFARTATAFDVVDYLAILRGNHDERRRRVEVYDVLARVGLDDRASDRVRELSGGMRRRLGLAQAIQGNPSLLILDEPAAGLDPDERLRLRDVITERRLDSTIVVSTHHTDEAALGDRVVVLDDGSVRFDGTPPQLAAVADGRTWIQRDEPADVRASWRNPDGSYRCLGTPPANAAPVAPTLEDGYLLLIAA